VSTRFQQLGKMEDMQDAIMHQRQVLNRVIQITQHLSTTSPMLC
jgi:hypothetical protein